MAFAIEHEHFKGPLELLLDLIEKRKLNISLVSLAQVADDFVSYVKNLGIFPIAESAEFILTASALLLIKSKSLLPTLELTADETASMEDLERRLKLLEETRRHMPHIKTRFGQSVFFAPQGRPSIPIFTPNKSLSLNAVLSAIQTLIAILPKENKLSQVVVKKVVSIEEMISRLTDRIGKSLRMSFSEFSGQGKADKVSVIVSFLALLELVRQGAINVAQESRHGDIAIETERVGVPRY